LPLIENIDVQLPPPLRETPKQSGMFGSLPTPQKLEEKFNALKTAAPGPETLSLRSLIAKDLEHMHGLYHPGLMELLPIIRAHADELSDAWLERSIDSCEVALHGARSDSPLDAKLAGALLPIASYALDFIVILSKQKLRHYSDAPDGLHQHFFHFSQSASACIACLGNTVDPQLHQRVQVSTSIYILLARMDFYCLTEAQQNELFLALDSVAPKCSAYFVPSEVEVAMGDVFWLEWEYGNYRNRPLLRKPPPNVSKTDRVVVCIDALIRLLATSKDKHGGVSLQSGSKTWPAHVQKYVLERLKTTKQKGERATIREHMRVLQSWNDIVLLENTRGDAATLLDVDSYGFRAIIEDHVDNAPNVGDMIVIDRMGQDSRRALVAWKRVGRMGAMFGCKFILESFTPARLGFLGHSEIAAGAQEWVTLLQKVDDKLYRCYFGDPQLQEGISVLLPVEGKSFTAMLDRVDYRGANYCQGVLIVGKEWQDSNLELDV